MIVIFWILSGLFVVPFVLVFVYATFDSNRDEIKDFLCSLVGIKTTITEQYVNFTSYHNFESYHSEPGSVSVYKNYSGGYSGTYSKGISWSSKRESYTFETPNGKISISVRDDHPDVRIWDDKLSWKENFVSFENYGILTTKSRIGRESQYKFRTNDKIREEAKQNYGKIKSIKKTRRWNDELILYSFD